VNAPKFLIQPLAIDIDAKFLSIGELSCKYDVTLRALRFYEKRGLLIPIRRGQTRLYDSAQVERLKLILKGKDLGFTLTEIVELLTSRELEPADGVEFGLDDQTIIDQLAVLEQRHNEINKAIETLKDALNRNRKRALPPVFEIAGNGRFLKRSDASRLN
jgi:DNA-binding transcriptional MerR regulator